MLTQFYKDMQAWVDAGCPDHPDLHPSHGLCTNLRAYAWANRGSTPMVELHDRYDKLSQEMRDQFSAAGLDPAYPFNEGFVDFDIETNSCTKYQNPKRLDWIKHHATT